MTRTYTIPELDALWEEVDRLKKAIGLDENSSLPARISPPPATTSRLTYSRREAAQLLSISVSTLDQLITRGDIKIRQLGNRIFVPYAELEKIANRDIPKSPWPEKRDGKTVKLASPQRKPGSERS